LRWANVKYKGTLAFRATLWHREDDKSAEGRAACLDYGRHREEIQGFPHHLTRMGNTCVAIPGRQSLKLHATEIPLSRSKRKEKINVAPRSRQFTGYVTKIRTRVF
jgi:hypothetical protein